MPNRSRDIRKIFEEGVLIDRAIRHADREARLLHKRSGLPLVFWRDGRVRHFSPDEMRSNGK